MKPFIRNDLLGAIAFENQRETRRRAALSQLAAAGWINFAGHLIYPKRIPRGELLCADTNTQNSDTVGEEEHSQVGDVEAHAAAAQIRGEKHKTVRRGLIAVE